eukprot:snap_masked-scaffold_49-processed-gene-1.30-mRNA-1 protein AED:1.00 eAED:1.00 QI:0/0/0/0/1/1/2/0/396
MKPTFFSLLGYNVAKASKLINRQELCSPPEIEPIRMVSDNLLFNNLGGFSSQFCGSSSNTQCGGEECCQADEIRFTNVLVSTPGVDFVVRNLTEYRFRNEISAPPNGLVTPTSDLPQINLRNSFSVDLLFELEGTTLNHMDFTFFDLDTGDENAVEEITVCGSGFGELFSFYLEEDTKVNAEVSDDENCVTFRSTVTGFIENNPQNSNDAIAMVKQLAATVRFKDVSSFIATYKILQGPVGKGRNFLFAGNSFLAPDVCPVTSFPTREPTDAPSTDTKSPTSSVSHTPSAAPTVKVDEECKAFYVYVKNKKQHESSSRGLTSGNSQWRDYWLNSSEEDLQEKYEKEGDDYSWKRKWFGRGLGGDRRRRRRGWPTLYPTSYPTAIPEDGAISGNDYC